MWRWTWGWEAALHPHSHSASLVDKVSQYPGYYDNLKGHGGEKSAKGPSLANASDWTNKVYSHTNLTTQVGSYKGLRKYNPSMYLEREEHWKWVSNRSPYSKVAYHKNSHLFSPIRNKGIPWSLRVGGTFSTLGFKGGQRVEAFPHLTSLGENAWTPAKRIA